ncbi:hypothetical protein DICVIV_00317 [Dictyocaulus viviparus]|uniref:Uncharacterized protein n=1 Tax=Dictyocaulus viviparus TaxID=29172 RepID=A0A0D8YBJ0_DICVI|nr:hypothetical protein DICVIV_00317 [Dictyocaulus viviparus]
MSHPPEYAAAALRSTPAQMSAGISVDLVVAAQFSTAFSVCFGSANSLSLILVISFTYEDQCFFDFYGFIFMTFIKRLSFQLLYNVGIVKLSESR